MSQETINFIVNEVLPTLNGNGSDYDNGFYDALLAMCEALHLTTPRDLLISTVKSVIEKRLRTGMKEVTLTEEQHAHILGLLHTEHELYKWELADLTDAGHLKANPYDSARIIHLHAQDQLNQSCIEAIEREVKQ